MGRSYWVSFGTLLLGRGLCGQVVEQFPVAWVIEKVIQMLDHELLDVGVLIGELEHHSADEDLAAGVCFSFAAERRERTRWVRAFSLLSLRPVQLAVFPVPASIC